MEQSKNRAWGTEKVGHEGFSDRGSPLSVRRKKSFKLACGRAWNSIQSWLGTCEKSPDVKKNRTKVVH